MNAGRVRTSWPQIARPGRRLRIIGGLLLAGPLGAVELDLFDGFEPGWREAWTARGFPLTRATTYEVEVGVDGGAPALRADSSNANRALMRRVSVAWPETLRLRWRWRVESPLDGRTPEKSRGGDDYAARVFVIFETSAVPTRTRAINYVWSAQVPAGTEFPSPYTDRVKLVVLRSGSADAGAWQEESRDVLADYRRLFGREPEEFNGVAVMVDTDNTGQRALAWFSDLRLEISPAPGGSESERP